MPKGIKKLLFVFIFAIIGNLPRAGACSIESDKNIISLSAPVSWILYELQLLKDPKMDSVSTFHFTGEYHVNKLAGGLFLSAKLLASKKAIVFFDKSKELKAAIDKGPNLQGIEVKTRGKGPYAVHDQALEKLRPFLKNCEKDLVSLQKELSKFKEDLEKKRFSKRPIVFFLGEFTKSSRPPRLVVGADGFVELLISKAQLKTYPSSLHYVSWSPKILNKLSPVKVGLAQSDDLNLRVSKIEKDTFNVSHAGALSPGLGQIRFMQKLLDNEKLGLFKGKHDN